MATSGDLSGVLRDLATVRQRTERLDRRVEALEGLPGQLQALAEALGEGADAPDDPPGDPAGAEDVPDGPIWWPALDDETYARRLGQLRDWLAHVAAACYPRELLFDLAPCWARHPGALDALTLAWLTWAHAYRLVDPTHAADWQLRWRPELMRAAVEEVALCRTKGAHQSPQALDPALLRSFGLDVPDEPDDD